MSNAGRLLLPLTYGLSVRYALPTGLIDRLSKVCDPVVALSWSDPDLELLLQAAGAEVVVLPEVELSHEYRMFRRRIGWLRDRRLASPTSKIRRQRQRAALPGWREVAIHSARSGRDALSLMSPGAARAVEVEESAQVERGTNVAEFRQMLDRWRIDAVLSLTPYHDHDALLLWAARTTGRPSITSVISFDNPTTRERIIVRSERVLVWNRYNADELTRSYPDLAPEQVGIIGAPQFDLHHRPDLRVDRGEWCRRLGIPADRPVILYGAGPTELVPGEQALIRALDASITQRRLPDAPYLLVRRHPVDPPGPWRQLDAELVNGRVVDPWVEGPDSNRSWPTRDDLVVQMSSLAHAEVHVNIASSMTLDGAVFDRPQVGPVFVPGIGRAERARLRSFYAQEHWLPIARSDGLAVASDLPELLASIREGLEDPTARRAGRRRMVDDVLTFTDGRSTERLVEQIVGTGYL